MVRSRQRVADHGEVFTPRWLVDGMLDLVSDEAARIDSRFLEPACGSGNFLVAVLERKLASAQKKHGRSEFEFRHSALLGLMCSYGIELLPDNAAECRANLLQLFTKTLKVSADDIWSRAAAAVLDVNIVRGDALAMTTSNGEPIVFPEWGYLGRGKYQRRDFAYKDLTQRSLADGTLFEQFDEETLFAPVTTYPVMTVEQIADLHTSQSQPSQDEQRSNGN
ncbi:N-6 DNA methylase [Pseudoclavibacter sp. CFCC 14310]|nr:N-6 DNA methylase [Pseudoclavibacter sp. CFCC 14310]